MKLLYGTTNLAKINYLKKLLKDENIEIISLEDLKIASSPEETGNTPLENALIKAKFYSQFFDCVICQDSGLYFNDYDLDDKIQPGLYIRRVNKKVLNDEELLSYYSGLAKKHGGKILAHYVDGFAIIKNQKIFEFQSNEHEVASFNSFYIVGKQHSEIKPGWPIDSISVSTEIKKSEYEQLYNNYRQKLKQYILDSIK